MAENKMAYQVGGTEMKATELMIGDWILIENTPRRIVQITKHKIGYHKTELPFGECKMSYARLWDITPIPLTVEILEKNGFVNDCSYDECIADGHFITVQIWSYSTENVLIQWDGITCKVINDIGYPCEKITLHGEDYEHDIYVHELQHALRLCGLTELAENFKI